eukprot:TRINITY_DN295_c0_g1_i1.p1 TRINITY_DN295_c0_g1~~TRINITY_DN295_c0_g1_i1.p1  ORF type:complete len:456 (+),score=59.51 TRINITY_DN295_c0_g1_i1:36-1403(+)
MRGALVHLLAVLATAQYASAENADREGRSLRIAASREASLHRSSTLGTLATDAILHINAGYAPIEPQPPPGIKVPAYKPTPYDPRFEIGRNNVLGGFTVCLILIFAWWFYSERHQPTDDSADKMIRTDKSVEEDTYGFAIVSLVRDLQQIDAGDSQTTSLRNSRMAFAIGLLFFTVLIQAYVTFQVKKFVTAKWVHDIRNDYDAYEMHMYGDAAGATTLTVNGKHRGVDGHFMPGNFETLDAGLKEKVCNIPFSQTPFFMCVLLIWSLTCVGEVRSTISAFRSYIVNTKNVSRMRDALQDLDDELDDTHPDNRWVIDGLTAQVKAVIIGCVLLPRLLVTLVLLWLGCRFLAATNDFGEMVLNAVALEFVLLIKDLLYRTIVPDRNKREIEKINIRPSQMVEYASFWAYLGTFSWAFVAVAWIFYYVFWLQLVLPQYRWDVRALCSPWLEAKYGAS